jgi:soluble lytic murein transglycosylase-like protein
MSIANLLGQFSPTQGLYADDRAQSDDYDQQISAYTDLYNKYKQDYDVFKQGADAYNQQVKTYNDALAAYKEKAEAYNAAIKKFNEGDRTVAYEDTDYYVARPDDFTMAKPEFTQTEPTAPAEPGFNQADIDQFVETAQNRAANRTRASAAALNMLAREGNFAGGAAVEGGGSTSTTPEFSFSSVAMADGGVVPPPTGYAAPVRAPAASGLGYYIPPELRKMGQAALGIASAIDPAQGIMRGMAASGRAFDSSLTPEQRKQAAIEAGLETAAPLGIGIAGKLAKQPIRAILMDMLTPTGATKEVLQETAEDLVLGAPASMARRNFLKGAAATAGVAAIAPDLAMEAGEAVTKATKAAAKARINPLDMAMQNIKELRRQIDEQYGILDEIEGMGVGADRNAELAKDASNNIQTAELEIIEEAYDAIMMMDKSDFAEAVTSASDDALEAIIEPQYESIMGNQRLVDDGENSVRLAQEAHRRGLHLAKDENGIDKFPNARAFVEDFYDAVDGLDTNIIIPKENVDDDLLDSIGVYRDDGNLNMTRNTPTDVAEDIEAMKIRAMYRTMEDDILNMQDAGASQQEIDAYRAAKQAEIYEAQGLPSDMDDFYAEGGIVTLAEGGEVVAPASEEQLSAMRVKVINDYGFDPITVAMEEGVDPELYLRVMYRENKGRQGPVSDAGAIGLMQLMPGTAEELGVDPNDPKQNAIGGARYLRKMLNQFDSVPLALAAYNAGPGNVAEYGGIPPFAETQNYVKAIAPAITNEDTARLINEGAENYLMAQPVANQETVIAQMRETSPVPQLRPFNIDYYPEPASSPRPQLRPAGFLTSDVHQQLNPALR